MVVGACKIQRGTVFLLPGNGGVRLEADALKARSEEQLLALPVVAATDTMEVLFCNGKETQLLTIYGLLGKVALEGYPNARLNLHTLTKDGAHAGGLDRWSIERVVEKWWVASKRKKRKASEGEPPAATWRDAASHLHDVSNVPNELVMWTWYADLYLDPQPTVRLVSPALVWSRTLDLEAGAIFQFA